MKNHKGINVLIAMSYSTFVKRKTKYFSKIFLDRYVVETITISR